MNTPQPNPERLELSRRDFVKVLGAGLLVTVTGGAGVAAYAARGARDTIVARIHLGEDGVVTVLTGKVEMGQGARTEISQAVAEELRVPLDRVVAVMGDTDLTPDDGGTYGSRTTGYTLPDVRRGAAAARELLVDLAAKRLDVPRDSLEARDGAVTHAASGRSVSYGELAGAGFAEAGQKNVPEDIEVTPVREWKVMGQSAPKVNARDIVTGAHRYPSDIVRPGMLYGRVLRAPAYNATLEAVDLAESQKMDGVVAVRDGGFVGCAAPTSWQAQQALDAIAKTAKWTSIPHPSSAELFAHLKSTARYDDGRGAEPGAIREALEAAPTRLQAVYEIPYIQHVPMEPRAAVAEWEGDKVTVWTGSQVPTRVHEDVCEALSLPPERVRVLIPDTGGGFGGKHSGETAVEAARLAKAAGKPVRVAWTRAEEFNWAYFRPAGLIEIDAALDAAGKMAAWDYTNINSGGAGLACPYDVPAKAERFVPADSPLKQGSYRALAATANHFARESFVDELARKAGADPLAFRLANLSEPRLRAVLEAAAQRFGWPGERKPNRGIGIACGTEKGSFTAACAEIEVDPAAKTFRVVRLCEAFECGAIVNPANLRQQVEGCIVMGLGGALTEEIRFEKGVLLNGSLQQYRVPRFKDVPPLDLVFVERPDLPSVGAGETPIVPVAPAIANAFFDATGVRLRRLPLRHPE